MSQQPILEAIQGDWIVRQAYEVSGQQTWVTGTLTIKGNAYTFKPSQPVKGTAVKGELGFLFGTPKGQVMLKPYDGVTPEQTFGELVPGDQVATCVFRAGSGVAGEFTIQVGGSNSLQFDTQGNRLWSVTRQVRVD